MKKKTNMPFRKMWTRNKYIAWSLLLTCMFCANTGYGIGKKEKVEYYEKSVKDLFVDDKWEEGRAILMEGLKLYPESSELNELAGSYYYQLKDYDNARYFLVRAVKETPDNVTAKNLLINVEEETGNYSSAICYVNELLEITPYWQGLWKKKIALYRLQGNDIEADRLLKRLFQIYPNDTAVRQDYISRLEENYLKERKKGDKVAAIQALRELLEKDKSQEVYYLDLANLFLQQGTPESALETVSEGVISFPSSISLISKKAEILSGLRRYPESLAFLEDRMNFCKNTDSLQPLYNSVLEEYARSQQESDPYRIYGKLYTLRRDKDVLNYLIDESIRSAREEDMKKYIDEARKTYGDTPELRYKEYEFYKRQGSPKAIALLDELYKQYPNNYDIAEDVCALKYTQAETLREDGAYKEAARLFDFVAETTQDIDLRTSALQKLYSVYIYSKQYDAAEKVLESLREHIDPEEYVGRKAEIMNKKGEVESALEYLYDYFKNTNSESNTTYIPDLYEEYALPHIKKLIESGDLKRACSESNRLIEICPYSEQGIQYAISCFSLAGDKEESEKYIEYGLQTFPGNTFFIEKKASLLYADKKYDEAIALLLPVVDSLPGNSSIIASLSASGEASAHELIKSKQYDKAMAIIDTTLAYDNNNQRLNYTKGMIYEKLGQYDSAYVYQVLYKPDASDAREFKRHLANLERRNMRNELSMGVIFGGYMNGRSIAPVMDISYAYTHKKNRFFFSPAYTAREDVTDDDGINVPGGQAIRLTTGWEHRFSPRWSSSISVGWANDFFPKLSANAAVAYDFNKDWNLSLNIGYRSLNRDLIDYSWVETTDAESGVTEGVWKPEKYVRTKESLLNAGLTATKSFEYLVLTLKGDFFIMGGSPYFNSSAQLKYIPGSDGTSFVRGTFGIGSAPELDVIDCAMPGSFSKINVFAGLGGGYMIGKHMLIGLDFSYSTLYSQSSKRIGTYDDYINDIQTKYKNMFNVYTYISFYF